MAIAEEFYPNSKYTLEDAMPIITPEDLEIQ
eukprot:CAMPEP_0168313476 /NCGR_PEP_ID=MMETSP0210-20121227/2146_1 /TAXON_ID=40633 /ORGANISM="Condylostoma magnum, Strain COL2" /LENGTH=30 /DNA_ID= /DNA_START= /DNA_END= /DNA_ORIENTATION=